MPAENKACLPDKSLRVSPELTEVLPEHLQSSLQEVLDGVTFLHLRVRTQTHTRQCSVYLLTEDVWVDWPHTVCIKLPLLVMVYLYSLTMPRAVPVAERDLNLLTWRHTHTHTLLLSG